MGPQRHLPRLTLVGHHRTVRSVAFSPNGQLIASVAGDVRVWSATTGAFLATFFGHPGGDMCCVLFTPNGRTLITGGDDGTVRLWSLADGRLTRIIAGHRTGITAIAISPDGKLLANGSRGNTDEQVDLDDPVRLWSLADDQDPGLLLPPPSGQIASTDSLAFSPDGRTLAVTASDGMVRLWNIEDQKPAGEPLPKELVGRHYNNLAFSPDSTTLAVGGRRTAVLFTVATGAVLAQMALEAEDVYALAFSRDGRTLAVGSNRSDNAVELWRVAEAVPAS